MAVLLTTFIYIDNEFPTNANHFDKKDFLEFFSEEQKILANVNHERDNDLKYKKQHKLLKKN